MKLPAEFQLPDVRAATFAAVVKDWIRRLVSAHNAMDDRVKWGNGSPESVVTSAVGTMYLRLDGGASTTLYIKESGTGPTGWVAK